MRKSIVYYQYITILLLYIPKLNNHLEEGTRFNNNKTDGNKIKIDFEDYSSTFYTIQLFYGDNKLGQNYLKISQSFPIGK